MNTRGRLLPGLVLAGFLVWGGLALLHLGIYGLTVFMVLPGFLGAVASWTTRPSTGACAAQCGALTAMVASISLLATGLDGLLCVVMALPLTTLLGALGGWFVYRCQSTPLEARGLAMILLVPPAGMTWDVMARPQVYQIKTAVEIAASPETVWKQVIAFPELPAPEEWYFRAGLAYPIRARIEGSGVGAIRYCEFSTGPFVEPVEVWDEPRLLRFQVTANPAPMREWSPYAQVSPRHLKGYLISKQGEFRLTELPNHHTLLEGTTWYQHSLWPAEYWRWWSDAIIHRIHLRVLNHIRVLAEKEAAAW